MTSLPISADFNRLLEVVAHMGEKAYELASQTPSCREFLQRFPANSLNALTLDDYCVGKANRASFCWWLERGLEPVLGRYMPGTAKGHILYFQPDGVVYKNANLRDLEDVEALRYTLAVQAAIAKAGGPDDWAWIDDDHQLYQRAGVEPRVTVGDARKLRLLMAYHPDDVPLVNSPHHLGHFLTALGLKGERIPSSAEPVARTLLLRRYWLMARDAHPNLSTLGFMRALYSDELGIAPKGEELEGEEVSEEPTIEVVLTDGAVRNGYVRIPKQQTLFPERFIASDEEAQVPQFSLRLPDGQLIQTCLLANRGRIKARFNSLFARLKVEEGSRVVFSKQAEGQYAMDIGDKQMSKQAGWPFPVGATPEGVRGADVADLANEPLNQILYGPPGTGKTYATIERTLRILDPGLLAKLNLVGDAAVRRARMKERFDALKEEARVRFVTFHQSFSYEDFVEGIRAQSGPSGLSYSVEPGVFKQLCEDATGLRVVDKIVKQFLDIVETTPMTLKTPKGKSFTVSYQGENETVACLPASSTTNKALPANIESVKQVLKGQRPQKIYCESYVLGIANHLKQQLPAGWAEAPVRLPHVLIIDEINRGNVSRIFGELITLIEPSKRAGQAEALSTTLPYSREPFSVPDNVYLIGTMNTADRSLASLDVALRRRFVFEELPPEPALLNGVKVADRVPIDALLSVMNQRIEALLDRDHLIGHASFMPLVAEPTMPKLAEVFRRQVLPLLQEYFFEDWQRIQWVLNDHRKPKALQFVRQSPVKVADLFGANVQVSARPLWEINEAAFDNIDAYVGVISSPVTSAEETGAPAEDAQ